jgi:hypothetical protein
MVSRQWAPHWAWQADMMMWRTLKAGNIVAALQKSGKDAKAPATKPAPAPQAKPAT